MLLVGYGFGIPSERRLCEDVHLNLARRWFCRLGLEADAPDHSTFSGNRHGCFRDGDLLRRLFEPVLRRRMDEGLTCVPGAQGLPTEATSRAVEEYLAVLGDAAFGGALTRSIHEGARDVARDIARTPAYLISRRRARTPSRPVQAALTVF